MLGFVLCGAVFVDVDCSVVLCVVEWKVVMLLGFVWCFVMRYCVVMYGL